MNQVADATAAAAAPARTLFGQPRGLATLFLTEMWEHFSYYGMRGVHILFMVAAVSQSGLGLDDKTASAIYGMYIGGTYLFGLLGGWTADRLRGPLRLPRGFRSSSARHGGRSRPVRVDAPLPRQRGRRRGGRAAGRLEGRGGDRRGRRARCGARHGGRAQNRRRRHGGRGFLGDAGARRRLLRVSALLRGAHRGRAPARAGDGGAGRGVGDLLGRLRADRRLDESLRRPLYRSAR